MSYGFGKMTKLQRGNLEFKMAKRTKRKKIICSVCGKIRTRYADLMCRSCFNNTPERERDVYGKTYKHYQHMNITPPTPSDIRSYLK